MSGSKKNFMAWFGFVKELLASSQWQKEAEERLDCGLLVARTKSLVNI
jgi:hypothetical protein